MVTSMGKDGAERERQLQGMVHVERVAARAGRNPRTRIWRTSFELKDLDA